MMRFLVRAVVALVVLSIGATIWLWVSFGGGKRLEDRSTDPALPSSALEVVANLELPPGNIAVSRTGRVFFTFHPEASPPIKVAELVQGTPIPYPNGGFQKAASGSAHFQTPLALRIDQKDRLWVLDYGRYGFGEPRIVAFDLKTNAIVDRYDFPAEVAGRLSMLNDFQVDPRGRMIYIAESSIFGRRPAIVVYDTEKKSSRRLLEKHPSVMPKDYVMNAAGREMVFFGLVTLKIGVDSIALDKRGEWLYYAPVSDDRFYRISTRDLDNEGMAPSELDGSVEPYGPKTLSDGSSMDLEGNVYVTDMEHSAILALGPDRKLKTLVKDPRLRWPDGLSFGPGGWLYVTCSALHQVILESSAYVREHAPYQIFRFKPGTEGVAGQ